MIRRFIQSAFGGVDFGLKRLNQIKGIDVSKMNEKKKKEKKVEKKKIVKKMKKKFNKKK